MCPRSQSDLEGRTRRRGEREREKQLSPPSYQSSQWLENYNDRAHCWYFGLSVLCCLCCNEIHVRWLFKEENQKVWCAGACACKRRPDKMLWWLREYRDDLNHYVWVRRCRCGGLFIWLIYFAAAKVKFSLLKKERKVFFQIKSDTFATLESSATHSTRGFTTQAKFHQSANIVAVTVMQRLQTNNSW